jgi:guanine deaminase
MHESSRIAKENKCIIQTHLSENEEEISLVLKLFPECKSYTEVYKKYNCLYEKSVTAHCLHLSESEIELLAENNVSIAHCPSSNFFLKSGSIKFNNIHNKGINICLGSDVGAGPSFSLFDVIKSMNYMQPFNILPQKCFYMATIGGAKALDINNVTGSLVSGKDADFIILNPWSCYPEFKIESIEDLLAFLYYLGSSSMVERSFVRGKKIYDSHRNSQIMHSNYSYLID